MHPKETGAAGYKAAATKSAPRLRVERSIPFTLRAVILSHMRRDGRPAGGGTAWRGIAILFKAENPSVAAFMGCSAKEDPSKRG